MNRTRSLIAPHADLWSATGFSRLLGAAALAVSIAGCGPSVSVKGSAEQGQPSQTFRRVMVVGVSPNVNQRCAFEAFVVSQLSSDQTQAFASCNAVKQKDPLTRASIDEAIAAQQPDAVLATILVSKSYGVESGYGRDDRGAAGYKATDYGFATGYYGVYGVPVVYGEFQSLPSITTLKGDVHVSSRLYETKGSTVVYTLDTVAKGMESRDEALSSIADPIAAKLRKEGLTR